MSVVIVVSLLVAAAAAKTVSCIAFVCYCKISKHAQYVSSARLNFKMKI